MPGLCSAEQGQEPVPETSAALGRGKGQSSGAGACTGALTASVQICAPDLRGQRRPWANHRVRRGPSDGHAAPVGPSARSAASCPEERGVRGYHRDSSGCRSPTELVLMEGVLPDDALLRQAEGHGEQHVAALAG